jgi:hypothetical protein
VIGPADRAAIAGLSREAEESFAAALSVAHRACTADAMGRTGERRPLGVKSALGWFAVHCSEEKLRRVAHAGIGVFDRKESDVQAAPLARGNSR